MKPQLRLGYSLRWILRPTAWGSTAHFGQTLPVGEHSPARDHRDGAIEALHGAGGAEHRDDFVDARAYGAAGDCDAHRLRELAQLQSEAGEYLLEALLHRSFAAIAL